MLRSIHTALTTDPLRADTGAPHAAPAAAATAAGPAPRRDQQLGRNRGGVP